MQTIYSFTQFFNSICLAHPNIETFNVSDDMFDADTAKQTLFPLAYMVLNNATINGYSAMTYNVNLIVMDRVTDVTQDSTGKFNSITKDYKGITHLLDVWNNQKGICPYSGVNLVLPSYSNKNNQIYVASLDRIDSSKKYSKGNIQFVSASLNYMKGQMTHDETIVLCKIIALFWAKKE